jgi:hypothetical protein
VNTRTSNPRNALRSLLYRLGVTGSARVRALQGMGASKISPGSGVPSSWPLIFAILAATLTGLTFTATPALAAAPTVTAESFSHAGSASVTFHAEVNPEGLASTYRFEYGTSESYGSSTPLENAGAGTEAVSALAQVTGLEPETTYHFRLVASNEGGETLGADATFRTLPVGILGLPDGRGYELVSPLTNPDGSPYDGNVYEPAGPGNPREGIGETTTLLVQASADGNAVAYVADPPSTGGNGNVGGVTNGARYAGNQWLATRGASGGWTAADIESAGVHNADYQAFSSDLSVGFFDAAAPVGLAPGAPGEEYNVLYSRNNSDGSYDPFFTGRPPHRNAINEGGAPEFGFGQPEFRTAGESDANANGGELAFAGASANLGHLLFGANDALTPNAPVVGPEEDNLYDSVDGQAHLVNVLPNGTPAPGASFGSPSPGPVWGGGDGGPPPDYSDVISTDGSRIFFSTVETYENAIHEHRYRPNALYVRENDTQPQSPLNGKGECQVTADACTAQVDASEEGPESGDGFFWTASTDGSRVFFTDCRKLTAESTAVPSKDCGQAGNEQEEKLPKGNDLYEYNLATGQLTDLTVDHNASDPLRADVQGVVGASENGEYVYFVADGVLTNEPNARGEHATSGDCDKGALAGEKSVIGCNLYLRHAGVTTFIATLSAEDNLDEGNETAGDWLPSLGLRSAEVTSDGHSVVFMSVRSLTGYENEGLGEVYLYNIDTDRVVCVSCDPSGERPVLARSGRQVGGFLPRSNSDTLLHRWVSEDGTRVFFESPQALVPQATNGQLDVYEWERAGAPGGSCPAGAPSGGCIYLLSGGTSASSSYLLDASANGDDVFISTRAQLVPQDKSENYHVYDVRVGAAQPPAAPACSGTGCQGVPGAPPIFATPASVTADGPGNLPPPPVIKPKPETSAQKLAKALESCRKVRSRTRRGACEKRARARYDTKKAGRSAKKSGHYGRSSR